MASLRDDVAARCLETAGTSEIALSGVPGHTQPVSRYRALSSMILVGCLVFLLMCLQLVPHYLRRCPFAHHKMRNDRRQNVKYYLHPSDSDGCRLVLNRFLYAGNANSVEVKPRFRWQLTKRGFPAR